MWYVQLIDLVIINNNIIFHTGIQIDIIIII